MNRLLVILGLLGAGVLSTLALAQIEVGPREKPPEINPGEEPRPVAAPTDGRQVAVLDIRLMLADGKIRSAQVVEARRIDSVAPKVFQRQGGDWEVRINGSKEDAFYVFSPLYLEAETEDRDRNPFTYVAQDGAVNWSLVVPLYRGKRTIKAESVLIIDRRTGKPIMESNF